MSHSDFSPPRRKLLSAAVASAATLCTAHGARAQTAATMGEVYINGQRAAMNTALRPGDRVLTGPEITNS